MMLPTIWQIVRHYPFFIPLMLLLLLVAAVGFILLLFQKLMKTGNCPDCPTGKTLCFFACNRVASRLTLVDKEIRSYERLGSN